MLKSLRRQLAHSELFSHNQVLRDRWILAQAAALPAGSRVLDVGAGSAPYRSAFAHCRYETQDLQPLRPEQLRYGGYTQIDHVCDAAAIPLPDAGFDAILCSEVLEHVPEPVRVVGEFARLLRPGGQLILTAPLGAGIHQEPFHFYGGYTPWWYERFLGAAGFASIRVEANAGSFRFFAQEAQRFLRTTRPGRIPGLAGLLWLPLWVLLLPLLGLLLPPLCRWLDRYDSERRFTVGYHVTARRAASR